MFPANTEDALRRALCPVEYIEMPAVCFGVRTLRHSHLLPVNSESDVRVSSRR